MDEPQRPQCAGRNATAAFIFGPVKTHTLRWEFSEAPRGLLKYTLKADYVLPHHTCTEMTNFCRESFGVSEIGTLGRRWSFHPGLGVFSFRYEADRMFFMMAWSDYHVII